LTENVATESLILLLKSFRPAPPLMIIFANYIIIKIMAHVNTGLWIQNVKQSL